MKIMKSLESRTKTLLCKISQRFFCNKPSKIYETTQLKKETQMANGCTQEKAQHNKLLSSLKMK